MTASQLIKIYMLFSALTLLLFPNIDSADSISEAPSTSNDPITNVQVNYDKSIYINIPVQFHPMKIHKVNEISEKTSKHDYSLQFHHRYQNSSVHIYRNVSGDESEIAAFSEFVDRTHPLITSRTDGESMDALEHFFWNLRDGISLELGQFSVLFVSANCIEE